MRRASAACLVPVLVFALAGCHRGAAPRKAAASPVAALNAGGEPQWSAQVRGDDLSFSDGGDLALHVKAERTDHGAQGVVWGGALPAVGGQSGGVLKLVTEKKPCRDADTGMTYPLTATVQAQGRAYAGCAAVPGQGLGPRQ